MAHLQEMLDMYDDRDMFDMGDMADMGDMNLDVVEGDPEVVQRAPKRYIRDGHNPFEFYSELEFQRRFRFSKHSIMHGILPRIEAALLKVNNRGLPIPAVMQLLICLRFYATASFQLVNGDMVSVSQPTVSRIIFRISTLLAGEMREVIKLPSTEIARTENRDLFRQLGAGRDGIGLPGVDGAIDCTHIRLSHTRFQNLQEIYRNRKGYFSLNVQAVVGPRMEFLDLVPEWPGSNHDSRIFQNSRIYMRYREGQLTGTLVGDAGYPCLPFLLTPLANAVTDAQQSYNNVQGKTRRIVERAFGVWKRRFPCLSKGLATKLICTTTIVVACAVLHNISLTLNDVLPEEDEVEEEEEEMPHAPPHWQPGEGFAVRDVLIDRLFN